MNEYNCIVCWTIVRSSEAKVLRSLVVQKREQMYLIVTFANTQTWSVKYQNIKVLMLGIFFCTFPSTIISLVPIRICICSNSYLYLQLWTSSRGSDAFGEKIENKALCALSCIPSVYTVQWAIQCALCMYFSLSVCFFAHLDSTLGDTVSDHYTL